LSHLLVAALWIR